MAARGSGGARRTRADAGGARPRDPPADNAPELRPGPHNNEITVRVVVQGQGGGNQEIVLGNRRSIWSRTCLGYCSLIVPFLLAFATMVVSLVTLSVKNKEVQDKCPAVHCILNCKEDHHAMVDCLMVQVGGAVVCLLLLLFILSLLIRICRASKLSFSCVFFEFLVLFTSLGISLLVAITLTLGVESSCVRNTIEEQCTNKTVHAFDDYLRQSEFTAWASTFLSLVIVLIWIAMAIKLAIVRERRGDRAPLINQ